MPAFFPRDTDADVPYCAAPAVPAQLLLANHQKAARLFVLTMSWVKNASPIKDGKESHQKQFQSCLNFLSIVVCKVVLPFQE